MKPVIVLVGPTGVGKSDVAMALAQAMDGEIVSCDAMQVYREVHIACDKPSAQMRRAVAHHALDVVSVTENFDVARYRQIAVDAITGIEGRGKIPIVTGGSGMYVSVLLDGIFQAPQPDPEIRQRLIERYERDGPDQLYADLQARDPGAAAKIHSRDVKRIIRALEVTQSAGQPMSTVQKDRRGLWAERPGGVIMIGLTRPRDVLYQRVEARIDRMLAAGLVNEIAQLLKHPLSRTAATIIGVPEIQGYLSGEYDLERATYLLKRNTRHYVKRQLTWFRRDARIHWIEIAERSSVADVLNQIRPYIRTSQ